MLIGKCLAKGDVGPMRARIFEIIEKSKDGDQISAYYDFFMLFIIIASLIPLAFKEETIAFAFLLLTISYDG